MIGLLLSAGCGFGSGGSNNLPGVPGGKASVSGVIQAVAPAASINYTSADQAAPDVTCQLAGYPELGLFVKGYDPPAYTFIPAINPFQDAGELTWEAPFTISDLPAGKATICTYSTPYADYGTDQTWTQEDKLKTFTLSKSEPLALEPVVLDMGGAADGHSCSGRILLEGNPIGPMDLRLSIRYDSDDYQPYNSSYSLTSPDWTFNYDGNLPDRLYYSITGIEPDTGILGLLASNATGKAGLLSRYVNGEPAGNELNFASDDSMDLYVRAQADYHNANPNDTSVQGKIDCRVNLTGALDWNSDLVLVAEDVSGAGASANSKCSRFLLPEDIIYNSLISVELALLRAGNYSIDVYRLSADDSIEPQRIGGLDEPYLYAPPDLGEVEFDLAIPEGI